MILTIAHTFAYALIQTFGFSIFTLALQRLGRLKRLYRLKAFFFLLLMNAAGTMTYGEAASPRPSPPPSSSSAWPSSSPATSTSAGSASGNDFYSLAS